MERLGFFSEKLKASMAKFNLSEKSTAAKLGCTYEHVRKMVKGLPAVPRTVSEALFDVRMASQDD
jgi:ParB-like chromosome segregation protein Spo0J